MKIGLPAAIAALFVSTNVVAQDSAEHEVLGLERELSTAALRKDTGPAQHLFADDLTGVTSRGTQFDKAGGLAIIEGSGLTTSVLDNLRARDYGDAVVATGRVTFSGTIEGVPYPTRRVVFTDTWIRKGGRWQLVAIHLTNLDKDHKWPRKVSCSRRA